MSGLSSHYERKKELRSVLVRKLAIAQDHLCAGCGKPMFIDDYVEKPNSPTIDHVIPRSMKGRDGLGNLVLMHFACNQAKGDDIPTGCELIWLLSVNNRLGVEPTKW